MGEMKYRWAEFLMKDIYESEGYDVIHIGIPDLILLKNGKIEFVEIKCNNDTLKEDQRNAIELLKKHGFEARSELVVPNRDYRNPGYHIIGVFRGIGKNISFRKLTSYFERLTRKPKKR